MHGTELYRLKGCGNGVSNSDIHNAFPVRYLEDGLIREHLDPQNPLQPEELAKEIEIRGAMFDFTVRREQAITTLVNNSIQKKGIPTANTPMGYYHYIDLKLKTADEKDESCSLCCGLYKTAGDKRLASHLLWGLELLIPLVFKPLEAPSKSTEAPSASSSESVSVAENRPQLNWCLSRFESQRVMGSDVLDTGYAALDGSEKLTNLLDLPIPFSALNDLCAPPSLPNYADSTAWAQIWSESWMKLLEHREQLGNIFAAIYWSIGRQSGQIVRGIHDADVNWGTYADLLGNHCNSHPNNLVVLQHPSNSYFLAPLDFDLAFTRKSYQAKNATSFEECEPIWKELREMEANAMNLALGGLNLNSGVEGKADLSNNVEPIRIALRDTMVKASYGAYSNQANDYADTTKALEHFFQPLIRLALILSEDVAT